MKKIRVGILFGGRSAEHEISLLSARSIISAIDQNKYEIILIGINKNGEWYLQENAEMLLTESNVLPNLCNGTEENPVILMPKERGNALINLSGHKEIPKLDVIFPVLHGPFGEDGTVQGLLKLANIAFVGCSVLSSAIAMDKDVMKRLFRDAGLPTAKFLSFYEHQKDSIQFDAIEKYLGVPLFVKPANLGSSVGISKITKPSEFKEKLELAFQYDRKILLEEAIVGREIECSVLGNETPIVSVPGELKHQHEFYDYKAKYLDNSLVLDIPADLSAEICKEAQEISKKAYQVLGCEGMARVDLFLTEQNKIILNEVNTIPGFTSVSMYPKLWEASGLPYSELIDRLIQLALDRFNAESKLLTQHQISKS